MKPFEFANPQTEAEALDLLNDHDGQTAVLAGGTDLISLMQRELVSPKRVVNLKSVSSLTGVQQFDGGLMIGALTTLEDLFENPLLREHKSLGHVVDATHSIQVQSMGTVGGDLCLLPNCWYFRSGYGLLALQNGKSLVADGDNRYHAILGNQGPAKFVSASRFAPALIAWGAKLRIIGPEPERAEIVPLEYFHITPKVESHGVTILKPGQLISHILIPEAAQTQSASYEVMQMEGLDWPLAAAAACVELEGGIVRDARIVMGHVAPVPWVAREAAAMLVGGPLDERTASRAGDLAVATATPLSNNAYKVQLARTAVKRALLRATDQLEGVL